MYGGFGTVKLSLVRDTSLKKMIEKYEQDMQNK